MLPLPITPADALAHIVVPALKLLPAQMDTDRARVMILAIIGQESNVAYRKQVGGPAKGLGQFEERGGVWEVLNKPVTKLWAKAICNLRGHSSDVKAAYDALEHDDILAVVFIRLLLWGNPAPLPELLAADDAFDYYVKTWRPGACKTPEGRAKCRKRWTKHYANAVATVRESTA